MNYPKDELDEMSIAAQQELREGSADRAAEMFRQLVAAWVAVEGADGEMVLNWRGWVGQCLIAARRYEAAEEVLVPLLEDRARVFGPDHSSVFAARGNLAKAIGLSGRHDEALFVLERLLADRTRLLGAEDESTLATRGNIAMVLLQAGRVEESISTYEDLLADRSEILGENHYDTITTEENLWSARLRLPDPAAAIEEMLDRAKELEVDLGEHHLDTLVTYAKVGEALLRIGNYEVALDVLERVVDGRTITVGIDDSRTLSARRLRARAMTGLARFEDAIAEHEDIVARLDNLRMGGGADAALVLLDLLHTQIEFAATLTLSDRPAILRAARATRDRVNKLVARFEPDSSFRTGATTLSDALDELL